MPFADYVNRRLPRDSASQHDWIYGGKKRPPIFGGATNTGRQKRKLSDLHRFGYNPSPGQRFDPAGGTLGGRRQVVGTRPLGPEWWNDIAAKGTGGGALGDYRHKTIRDLMRPRSLGKLLAGKNRAVGGSGASGPVQDNTRRGPSGKTAGFIDDVQEATTQKTVWGAAQEATPQRTVLEMLTDAAQPSGTSSAGGSPRRTSRAFSSSQDSPTFGEPPTPMAQAIHLAMEEAALGNFGSYRALENLGILGPGGMQSILEQVEGPENRLLEDLPGRINDQINLNAIGGADARRQTLRGLETGPRQRLGAAKRMVAEAMIPMRMDEARSARGITQSGYDIADRISLGRGARRSDLVKENMKSKLLGLQGMAGATGQAHGMLGDRYWDTDDPMNDQYGFQSGLMGEQAGWNRRAASQQQGYTMYNDRMGNYYAKDQAGYNAKLQLWLEQMFKDLGLGDYYESAADYIDAFMPDSVSMFNTPGGGG